MFTTLRAFAWLRFRMFVNSLEQTGSRDMLERFSLAAEKLGPILAGVLLIPSGLALAALGAASGYAIANGESSSVLAQTPRFLLIVVPLLSVAGPLLLPAGDRSNPVRMLLLPIGRGTLYVAQSAAALGDVWVLLMLVLVGAMPVGLAAGGAPGAGLFALAAGIVLVVIVVAISSTTTSLVHLAVRDRRRGELLALLFLLLIPLVSMLPNLLAAEPHSRRADKQRTAHRGTVPVPTWLSASARGALSFYPTELYTRATQAAARRDVVPAVRAVGGLAASAVLLNLLGIYVFGKVLESPASTGARRQVQPHATWERKVPWLSPGASAVALAQLRLALRTPRGRAILLAPIPVVFGFGVLNSQELPAFNVGGHFGDTGLFAGCFASFICVMSILPIAFNQFAIDKAGLTRALLAPLNDRDYLAGKAVGNGMIVFLPAVVCITASFALLPGSREIASWLAIPTALLSVYFLAAPAAAMLSAMFPRVADFNSIGRGSNAHGLASLLGFVTFLAAGAPNVAIALGATRWFGRPLLTLGLLIVWCGITFLIGRGLFAIARRIFATRRENLAML
jgi:hypothetical protein